MVLLLAGTVVSCGGDDAGDDAAPLDDATASSVERAYLDAFAVSKDVLRDPERADNVDRLREHYAGDGLAAWRADLERALAGRLVTEAHPDRPSFAVVVGPARRVDDTTATVPVCEYNSDLIYERIDDDADEIVYDDPVSILIVAELVDDGGTWKVSGGIRVDDRRDEVEHCTTATFDGSTPVFAD